MACCGVAVMESYTPRVFQYRVPELATNKTIQQGDVGEIRLERVYRS